jgi:tetratricopeptide (TPR) repeat protein
VDNKLEQLQRSLHGEAPPRAFLVDHLLEQISHNQDTGDFHLIEQKAKRMIAADPTRPEGYFHLGVACQETKRPEEALKAFLIADELAPDHAPTLYNLANAYLHLQEPNPALPLLQRCLEVDHDKPAVLSLLGRAHLQLGDRERAIECWRGALQADPAFGPAQWRLFEVGEGPEPAEAPLTPTHLQLQTMSPVVKGRMRRPVVRRSGEIVLTLDREVGFVLEDHKNPRNGTIHAGSPFRTYQSVPEEDLLDLIGMIKLLMTLINAQNTRDIAILAYYAHHDNFNYLARFEDGKGAESSTSGRFIVDEAPRFFKIRIDSDLSTPYGDPMQGKLIYLNQRAKPGFMISTLGLEAVPEGIPPQLRLRG